MSYHFLGALITPVRLDGGPSVTWVEYKQFLETNLSKKDLGQMERVLHYFDLENLHLFRSGRPLTNFGNWGAADFEQLTLSNVATQPWLEMALTREASLSNKQQQEIQAKFFEYEIAIVGVAATVLTRLWKTLWVSAFFRARILAQESTLRHEPGADHPIIESLIEQLQSDQMEVEFEKFKFIFETQNYDVQVLSQSALEWQMEYLQQDLDITPFSLERLLVHLIQLAWVERWWQRHAPANWDPRATTLAALAS